MTNQTSKFKDLETCEINYRGIEQANKINYSLMLWEQGKWESIYRLVFPEEAPWGRVQLENGCTCSPYQWEKLINRLTELLAATVEFRQKDGEAATIRATNWRTF